jgi:hypothetical protein
MDAVMIEEPRQMNLLGLILSEVIARNLVDSEKAARFLKLSAEVVVRAGPMCVTLKFKEGKVHILRGAVKNAHAEVHGSLDALMALSLGGGLIGPWLSGRIKTRGNLLLLLKIRSLLAIL